MGKSDSTRPHPAVFIRHVSYHASPSGRVHCALPPKQRAQGALAKLVRKASWAVQLNEHIAERGDIVFRHACKLGFEDIVSKRLGSWGTGLYAGAGYSAARRSLLSPSD
jgi:hypothetical protein